MNYQYDIISTLRVKNGMPFVIQTFDQLKILSERILVLDDFSTDGTYEFIKSKIPAEDIIQKSLNEYEARSFLWEWAKSLNPKWILSLDADEIFENKIYKIWQDLINPDNPEVLAYSFPFFHIWKEGYFRTDGLWSPFSFKGIRLCRNINRPIEKLPGSLSHTFPFIPNHNLRLVPCKIIHYGNSTPEIRQRKFQFYKTIVEKEGASPLFLGPWENYYKNLYKKQKLDPIDHIRHIIDETGLELGKLGKGTISWNYISNNPNTKQIEIIRRICDEIVLITPKNQNLKDVKEIIYQWKDDFAEARNLAKKNSTADWILRLDDDEMILENDLFDLWLYAQYYNITGYVFTIRNKLKDGSFFISQTIRLFQNLSDIYYSRPVHEEIDLSLKNKKYDIRYCPVPILHFGYLKNEDFLQQKFHYYFLLNKKWIDKNPNDFYPYFSIAVHLKHIKNFDEAIKYYNKAIQLNPKCYLAYLGLAEIYEEQKQLDLALNYYIKTLKTENTLKPLHFDDAILDKIWSLIKKDNRNLKRFCQLTKFLEV